MINAKSVNVNTELPVFFFLFNPVEDASHHGKKIRMQVSETIPIRSTIKILAS